MACEKLFQFLRENKVPYERIAHARAYTAQEVADVTHVRGRAFAKTVMVRLDGELAMAVVGAHEKVNFTLLQQAAGAGTVSLCTEDDFKSVFPDCELGAMPPFGNIYGLDVHVSGSLLDSETLTFNAGTHTDVVRLETAEFERLVKPRVARFAFLAEREAEAR